MSMVGRVFRARTDNVGLFAAAHANDAPIARLPNRQAVARLDNRVGKEFYYVFADTPGEGLYVGYVRRTDLEPIHPTVFINPPRVQAFAEGRLSQNFTLKEFTHSNTAVTRGVENSATPAEQDILVATAAQMERVRSLLGDRPITITSAFRNAEVNAAVGGVPNSSHITGYAVDFVCPTFGTPFDIAMEISHSDIMGSVDQLIQEHNRWVHIGFGPGNRRELLTYYKTNGRTKVAPGIFAGDPNALLS